jgi:hypothetical protein
MNAAQEQFGSNPFQALAGSRPSPSQNSTAAQGGPVPNPWAPPTAAPGFIVYGLFVVVKRH